MKKKFSLILCLIILIMCGCDNNSYNIDSQVDYSKQISKLENQLNELENKNILLEKKLLEYDQKINEYENKIIELDSKIDNISPNETFINQTVVQQGYDETKLDNLNNDVEKLQQQNIELQNDLENKNFNNELNNNKMFNTIRFNTDEGYIVSWYYKYQDRQKSYSIFVKDNEKLGNVLKYMPYCEKINYVFNGWYTEPNGKGKKIDMDSTFTNDTELYAYYIPEVKVTFKFPAIYGNDHIGDTFSINKGTKLNEFKIEERMGSFWNLYDIEGYYSDSTFKNKLSNNYVFKDGETIYLNLIPHEYNAIITSNGNGVVNLSSSKIKANGSIIINAKADENYEIDYIEYCVNDSCNNLLYKQHLIECNEELEYPGWDGGDLKISIIFSKIKQ